MKIHYQWVPRFTHIMLVLPGSPCRKPYLRAGKGAGLDEGLRQGAPAQKGRGRMRGIRAGWSGCAAPEVVITCELQSPSCQLNYQMCISAPINNDQGNSKNNSMPLMLLSFYFVLNVYPKEQLN